MNPKVDWFFNSQTKWQEFYKELRILILESGVTEDLKWGCPCYTSGKSNIVLIHGFKDYCALLFMKGALLKDTKKILVQQTQNVQLARQIRFKNIEDILQNSSNIKEYLSQAILIEKEGLKLPLKEPIHFKAPEEFQSILDKMPQLNQAFQALTPGRKKSYLLYFSAPKNIKTRVSRIEKYIHKILEGKGIYD